MTEAKKLSKEELDAMNAVTQADQRGLKIIADESQMDPGKIYRKLPDGKLVETGSSPKIIGRKK